MRTLLCSLLMASASLAQATKPTPIHSVPADPSGCGRWQNPGLPEGPLALGYLEADLATGRRACPRTEVGLGGRFGAIIDTPDFYGALSVNGLVFASYAVRPDLELFGTLEALTYNYAQNAVLTATQLTLGNLTVGATWAYLRRDRYVSALSGRLLLPTSFEVPGGRPFGVELGHASSYRPLNWLEVHAYLGADLTAALSRAAALPRVGAVLLAGAQLSPVSWASLVVDFAGRLGPTSFLAPSLGLRFRVARLGLELAGTLPIAGTDRHDFILGGRFSWRLD